MDHSGKKDAEAWRNLLLIKLVDFIQICYGPRSIPPIKGKGTCRRYS